MKALFVIWFVAFLLMLGSVENLNCLFVLSFVTFAIVSYKISKKYEENESDEVL